MTKCTSSPLTGHTQVYRLTPTQAGTLFLWASPNMAGTFGLAIRTTLCISTRLTGCTREYRLAQRQVEIRICQVSPTMGGISGRRISLLMKYISSTLTGHIRGFHLTHRYRGLRSPLRTMADIFGRETLEEAGSSNTP